MNPHYLFVVNPSSGAGKGEIIAGLLRKLLPEHPSLGGGKASVIPTDRLDPSELAKELSHAKAVIAVGGDGTASRLIAYILACEAPPALGIIPLGTSNDLARALGMSVADDYTDERVLQGALDSLLNAEKGRLDVFSVNGRLLFCNYFSVGFDAAIVRDFDRFRGSRRAKLLPPGRFKNNLLYFLIGLKNIGFRLEPPLEIECRNRGEGTRLRSNSPWLTVIATNLPVYAGGCRIGPDASRDDGLFEITVVHNIYQFIRLILTRFVPFLRLPRGLDRLRAREATIQLRSQAPSQLDGEACAEADIPSPTLNISFRASLTVLIPDSPL